VVTDLIAGLGVLYGWTPEYILTITVDQAVALFEAGVESRRNLERERVFANLMVMAEIESARAEHAKEKAEERRRKGPDRSMARRLYGGSG
jgi:hypothetical protein